jgi:site-specific recombinase, phage integrase family|nr:MAG TPA: Integrase [Caudoviricetes sp.]
MALKRSNGSGSVYKMKHKKLRKPFRAVITTGWTDEGKPIRKTLGTYASQKEAYEALALFSNNPTALEKKRVITVEQCFQWYFEEAERMGLSAGRIEVIDSVKKLMKPIHHMDITVLKTAHVQAIFDKFTYSQSYQQVVKSALVKMCNIAIKNEVISKNYMRDIIISKKAAPIKKATPFTQEDIYKLWLHQDELIVRIILIYIYTGVRLNELLTMKVDDIHLKERYMVGGSKTDAGRDRIIPIAECIAPFVQEFYNAALFKRTTHLFDEVIGKTNFRNRLADLCERLGIARRKPHDTRHTFITLCSDHDIPEIIVKHIVGHATSKNITQGVYTHKTIEQYIEAVNKLPFGDGLQKVEQRLSNRLENA